VAAFSGLQRPPSIIASHSRMQARRGGEPGKVERGRANAAAASSPPVAMNRASRLMSVCRLLALQLGKSPPAT